VISIVDLVEAAGSGNRTAILPTAADAFAEAHDRGLPTVAERYRARMPVTMPAVDQQFAFDVSLDACTGCKACVAACHSLNGLDEVEAWRSVGVLHGTASIGLDVVRPLIGTALAEQRTVTTACHHCVDPSCMKGCPANAYEKDPLTGAVVHLDDQCIGCSYCTMTCPYEVPQFNDRLGIVRKCDMCRGRLVAGEAPACVQGCPNGAITIVVVDTAPLVVARSQTASLVPGAAPSSLSVPTTRYRSRLGDLTDMHAIDVNSVAPSHAHGPLALMLVLSQLGIGAAIARLATAKRTGWFDVPLAIAAVVVGIGMLASFAHLGRPTQAWRVVLGVRSSWLSREAIALGSFISALCAAVVVRNRLLDIAAVAFGLVAVASSIMVYGVTGRIWWSVRRVTARFGATMCAGSAFGVSLIVGENARWAGASVAAVLLAGWALTGSGPRAASSASLRRTTALLHGPLASMATRQRAFASVASLMFTLAALTHSRVGPSVVIALGASIAALVAMITERALFFTAVAPDRMPGRR
jgi:formate dehydrogenase iron-sulfur subunit